MMQTMLAIECSQRSASVAITTGGGPPTVEKVCSDRRSDDDLLPAIARLLSGLKMQPSDLTSVAVSIGPGGFTGLRISIAAAKMLGVSLGVKLIGVPSALVAAQSIKSSGPILVALACKGESLWATTLQTQDGMWVCREPGGLVSIDSFVLNGMQYLVADAYLPEAIRNQAAAQGVEVLEPKFDAASCLLVGQQMLSQDQYLTPDQLQPLYPREPEAVRLFNQR